MSIIEYGQLSIYSEIKNGPEGPQRLIQITVQFMRP